MSRAAYTRFFGPYSPGARIRGLGGGSTKFWQCHVFFSWAFRTHVTWVFGAEDASLLERPQNMRKHLYSIRSQKNVGIRNICRSCGGRAGARACGSLARRTTPPTWDKVNMVASIILYYNRKDLSWEFSCSCVQIAWGWPSWVARDELHA